MKYLKMLGLAAITAAALMAVVGAGTASATALTCSGGVICPKGTVIHAVSEGHAVLDNSFLGNVECNSTIEGKTSNAGGVNETVSGNIEKLTFEGCTSATVHVLKLGSLEVHTEKETANGNGTVTSTGTEVTVEKSGFHCIFKTNGTDIGQLTGSQNTGGAATFDISARIPVSGGRSGVFCGESSPWTGSYKVTMPEPLNVH